MLTETHAPHVFTSKVDWWLRVVTWAGALVPVGALITLAARGERGALWLLPVILIPAALPLWLLWSTDYTFTDTDLNIRRRPLPLARTAGRSARGDTDTQPALEPRAVARSIAHRVRTLAGDHGVAGRQERLPRGASGSHARFPMDRLRVSATDCADLPDVFWLEHDYPRLRLEQRLTALSSLPVVVGIVVARCNDCGQVWRVDKSDGRSVAMAIKVAALDAWKDEDDRAAQIEYLKRSYGGDDIAKCIWAGCQNRALKSLAMCAEHAYDRMGEQVRLR